MKRAREEEADASPPGEPPPGAPAAASPSSDPAAVARQERQERQERLARLALGELPDAEMYEKSYMHRDAVTHLVVTASDFLVTASRDGQLKFWKKQQTGVDFVKHFRAHLAPISGLSATPDGALLATSAADKGLKVFDVQSFDMIHWLKLDYTPSVCEWIGSSSASRKLLACADAEQPLIRIYDGEGGGSAPLRELRIHASPVLHIKRNARCGSVISIDSRGVIEYWSDEGDFGTPQGLAFRFKTETSLYELAKCKATPTSLSVSPDGTHFAVTSSDAKVRLFRYATGKTRRTYDESFDALNELQKSGGDAYRLEAFDFGRRMAVEREYRHAMASGAPPSNVVFDETGRLMLYASLVGVKVIAIESSKLVRLLGKVENTERFTQLALFQGRAKLTAAMLSSGVKITDDNDPTLFCAAFKRSRFYLFSGREPQDPDGDDQVGRDVFNEKPSKEDLELAARSTTGPLPRLACINTSYGEVRIRLFPDECPKTVENFTTHAANGYYDGVIFHRVIKGFMCQTGDPLGDGTGGTSIWGHEFEDEFHRSLRHDRPFTLSMANAGPNTNGSQFFITTAPCAWLDNKHTVFGRVVQGMDVVQGIEKVKCSKSDKPIMDIKIISILCMEGEGD